MSFPSELPGRREPGPGGPWPPGAAWGAYGWTPPPAPPPRPPSRVLLAVLIVLVSAALGASAIAAVLLLRYPAGGRPTPAAPSSASVLPSSASPTAPPPTAPPTAIGTASPPAPATASPPATTTEPSPGEGPTDRPRSAEDHLVRHPFNELSLQPTGCDQPPRPLPTSRAGYRKYLGALITCMDRTYAPLAERSGFTLPRPELLLYTGSVTTPCGQSPAGYAVFYCPGNQTIYATVNALNAYGEGVRLAGYYIVFHEYAHHLQQALGILAAGYTRDEPQLQISRRIELQADCWMGMTTGAVASARLGTTDRTEMRRWRAGAADEIHGSTAAQLRWVFRGFETAQFRRCSTWRSPPDQVR